MLLINPPRGAGCIGFHKAAQNLAFLPLQHIIKYQPGHCLLFAIRQKWLQMFKSPRKFGR